MNKIEIGDKIVYRGRIATVTAFSPGEYGQRAHFRFGKDERETITTLGLDPSYEGRADN